MARILLHTLVFAPDGVSTAYLLSDLVRELSRRGHHAIVLTTTPHYNVDPQQISAQPMVKRWAGLVYQSFFAGADVWHVKMPPKSRGTLLRILGYLRFHVVSVVFGLVMCRDYDVVLAPSPPLSIGVIAWILSLKRQVPFIYNLQEIYPDFAINQGLLRNRGAICVFSWLEKFVYNRASAIVPISDSFNRKVKERAPAAKLEVIPNFVDTDFYRPLPRDNSFAREHSLLDKFVVLYGGNLGLSQDWEALLSAAEDLGSLPIVFVITGDGARGDWLRSEISRKRLKSVRLLGYQPKEIVPMVYASCDIATIPMKVLTTVDTFPSKIFTIFACGKTVIAQADRGSELAHVIGASQCGRVVPPGDTQAYRDGILRAFQERDLLPQEGERGRAFVMARHTKEMAAARYERLIAKVCSA